MTLLKIKNTPIKLHYSWYIAFGLFTWSLSTSYFPEISPDLTKFGYWLEGVITTTLLFISVLLHELGHSFVAVKHGIKVESITMYIFGGIAKTKSEAKSPTTEFWLALAGPLVSFALAGLFFLFNDGISRYLFCSNIAIGILNLVPVFPLDGGRILRAILWGKWKNYIAATEKAALIGIYVSSIVIGIGIFSILLKVISSGIWLLIIGGFMRMASDGYYKQVKGLSNTGIKISDVMVPNEKVIKVPSNIDIKTFIEKYFITYGYHGYPVINEENKIIGMISFWHVNKLLEKEAIKEIIVKDIMMEVNTNTQEPDIFIAPTQTITDAMTKMMMNNHDRLFVCNKSRFIGIITKSMVMRCIQLQDIFNYGGLR